jgi:hypothetical protein
MEWADAETWRAVRSLETAQSDERLRWLFHHSHLVQSIYLQAWRGDPFVLTELKAYPDLKAIETWARPYYPIVTAFAEEHRRIAVRAAGGVSNRSAIESGREVSAGVCPRSLGGKRVSSLRTHTAYHRGQISTRIRENRRRAAARGFPPSTGCGRESAAPELGGVELFAGPPT